MSWSIGFDERWQRDIGYGVPAYCDFPKCRQKIDRGLAYVCCGEKPRGGDYGCGLYFCSKHHQYFRWGQLGVCTRCYNYRRPFKLTLDHPDWIKHKLTDESWEKWRKQNFKSVSTMRKQLQST